MSKNIVICCDGTGNQIEGNLSSVLKLFQIVERNERQHVFYDPGIGTIGVQDEWSQLKQNTKSVFGLATGYGLDDNVLEAYSYLSRNYEEGDDIYLFGFSRGAYTVRVVAGFSQLVGLLHPDQLNIDSYALTAYKRASQGGDFSAAWQFQHIARTAAVPIKFIGVWDTVASVLVPRKDRLYIPSFLTLPYTRTNPSVEIFRQAMAIDERRRMFRLNRWTEPQEFALNPFHKPDPVPQQDIKQVWFAGVHADIGGGYPESESAISKYPLDWMINEAKNAGLHINTALRNQLVLGQERKGSRNKYVAPSATGPIHNSMTAGWEVLEWLPKPVKWRERPDGLSLLGFYLPRGELRVIPEGARLHYSVIARKDADRTYSPPNLPQKIEIENYPDSPSA